MLLAPWIDTVFVLAFGLAFGSFVTCMSYRLPRDENVVSKPSFCPACQSVLRLGDLWPFFSWVWMRGKCRYCRAPIPWRYPLIELVCAMLFLLIYREYGIHWLSLVLSLMAVALMVMIVVDLEHYIIPDSVHVALIPLGVIYHLLLGSPWDEVAISTATMTVLALFLHYGYSAIRGRVMLGFGDVKFFVVAGLWLGLWSLVPFLLLSGALGVVLGIVWRVLGKGEVFPFGPALAIAFFLCTVYRYDVNAIYYISLFGK